MIKATILTDSINNSGNRLTTLELVYPRYILPQVLTHRVFSRNTSSSRAIPVRRMIDRVKDNPSVPTVFYANKKGMQSHNVHPHQFVAGALYKASSLSAVFFATIMKNMGIHKQHANRLLEPYGHVVMILSATEFDNFFKQRISKHAQHEIHDLAVAMNNAMKKSVPVVPADGYHLPYVTHNDRQSMEISDLVMVSSARCARVSYRSNATQKRSTLAEDVLLGNRLAKDGHMSPFEHVARIGDGTGNFRGWNQFRSYIETGNTDRFFS